MSNHYGHIQCSDALSGTIECEEYEVIVSYVLIQKQSLLYLLKVVYQYPTSLVDLGHKFNGDI